MTDFPSLGVPSDVVARLSARSLVTPTPVQAAVLPEALAGRDVVAQAPTGSGKTLAFAIPLVARGARAQARRPRALILTPTRELAAQIQREVASLVADGRRVIAVYGGMPYNATERALRHGVDTVVACPGRLEDLLERGSLSLEEVDFVVVDEADRMADMGFLPSVRRLLAQTDGSRQVLLFSATMASAVRALVSEFTQDAAHHELAAPPTGDVVHHFWSVSRERRTDLTAQTVRAHGRAIVFTRTKHGADRLARQLAERGVPAAPLHGDRSQAQRERALKSLAEGRVQALVATDVAARGIHIDSLPAVIHFDPAGQAADYQHRSGRTGRAGATGTVISFVTSEVRGAVRRLQRELGIAHELSDHPEIDEDLGAARHPQPERPAPVLAEGRPSRAPRAAQERTERRRPTSPRSAQDHQGPSRAPAGNVAGRKATVTFFNDARGFGFASDRDGDDLFVHFSQIQGSGRRTLSKGQRIAFEEVLGPRGREARNVRVLEVGTRRR